MNTREALTRLRYVRSSKVAVTMMKGNIGKSCLSNGFEDTHPPQYRRHPPRLHLTRAERGNPHEVLGVVDTLSKLTAREAELLSGNRKDQEAKAASRKATGIHNWADRAGNGDTHAERRLT